MSGRTGAASAEQEVGGIVANIIPKEGGNAWSGSFYAGLTDARLQGDNLTQRLKDQGLQDVSRIVRNHDISFGLGGPVIRNTVWFFTSGRSANSRQTVAGLYLDTDPNDWVYTPDFSKPAIDEVRYPDANARLTWQMNQRNKVGIFMQRSGYGQVGRGLSGQNIAPAASRIANYIPNLFGQVIWKSTMTSRLLVEAGYSSFYLEERRADFHPSNGHPLGTHPGNKTESWCVCPGSVDRSETHAQCRRAVRLFPGAHRRDPSPRRPMGSCARFPGGRGCAELERH